MSDSGESETSAPPYTSLAILGATGKLGSYFLRALSEHPLASTLSIRLLTRQHSPNPTAGDKLASSHPNLSITLHEIEYNKGEETERQLASVLEDVEVVISTVGDPDLEKEGKGLKDIVHCGELPGFKAQEVVARAAKKAGVKLFVPS